MSAPSSESTVSVTTQQVLAAGFHLGIQTTITLKRGAQNFDLLTEPPSTVVGPWTPSTIEPGIIRQYIN